MLATFLNDCNNVLPLRYLITFAERFVACMAWRASGSHREKAGGYCAVSKAQAVLALSFSHANKMKIQQVKVQLELGPIRCAADGMQNGLSSPQTH
jgi:hypothetical protein